jgi:site-specific DNA recombinase
MPQMRLRAVTDINPVIGTKDPLLPLSGLRDSWRHLGGSVCDNRPIRQDLLDKVVWQEVIQLIEDPTLIGSELDRRLEAARAAEPAKRRQESLERELTRVTKSIDRLVTAYQEDLLPLEELRRRMPELRSRDQVIRGELQTILDQTADRLSFLRLAETLSAFLTRLKEAAHTLDISERQKIVRLLVKEVLVDDTAIIIRHSIPMQHSPSGNTEPLSSKGRSAPQDKSYLLRSGRERTSLRSPFIRRVDQTVFHHPGVEKRPDEFEHTLIGHSRGDSRHQAVVIDSVEEFFEIEIDHDVIAVGDVTLRLSHRMMRGAPRSKAVTVLGRTSGPTALAELAA